MNPACSACGASNPDGFKFCGECGNSFKKEDTPDRGAPEVYTPKHLKEKVLSQRSALEGEKKQVSIMFADVKGSMELADEVGPEEWHSILDRFFELLSEGVHRFEGTVNQYTGDGIMALFGAPIAHEDHARRACYAALHLQETLNEYSMELLRTKNVNLDTRIGINSGEVIVGKIGDDLRMDYTAQGHTVGLAQRMEQLAKPGTTFLTDTAAQIVDGFFKLDDKGEFNVKGVAEPMHVFSLEGTGHLRTRLELSEARGFSTFVGRSDEMRTLEVALKNAIDGRGQVAGVVGDAGVGKSRLCFEFLRKCREQGVSVYESHCPAHGQTIPYLPVLELLRNYYGITDHDSDEEARRRIAGTLVLLDQSFNDALPLMFEFLGVADPSQPKLDLNPDARMRQLMDYTRRISKLRGETDPAVIYIDDMHWVDPGSDLFVEQFIETLDQTRTLMLLNFRPEYQPAWNHKPYYQQLPMVPLGPEAISEMIRELLGNHDSLANLSELVEERTGGNPFFIEEVIQTLVEAGSLVGSRGDYQLTASVDSLEVPGTVRAILAARIDRLDQDAKHVLQTASVIGKEFSRSILTQVAEINEDVLAQALTTLQSSEFVYPLAIYPVEIYTFKHPLTQEVALDTQLQERKRGIHVSVAQAILNEAPDKQDEHAAVVAYHSEAAEDWDNAVIWNARAAEWIGVNDPVGGARHWKRIVDLHDVISNSEKIERILLQAYHMVQAMGTWRTGLSDEDANILHANGTALAEKYGDQLLRLSMETYYAGNYTLTGRSNLFREWASEHGDEILGLDPEEDIEIVESILNYTGYGYFVAGIANSSLNVYQKAIDATKGDISIGNRGMGYSVFLLTRGIRERIRGHMGYLSESCQAVNTAHTEAMKADQTDLIIISMDWIVENIYLRGEPVLDADRMVIEVMELTDRAGSSYAAHMGKTGVVWNHINQERWTEAIEASESHLAFLNEYEGLGGENRTLMHALHGIALIGAGLPEKAEEVLSGIEKKTELDGSTVLNSLAFVVLAKAILAQSNALDRVHEIESALALADRYIEERQEKSVLPHATETRARMAQMQGDDMKETQLFLKAVQEYQSVGATGHVRRLTEGTALS